ncbi:MAG: hypothetical protein WAN75_10480, partial [Xanthobacteraceae bacterium]
MSSTAYQGTEYRSRQERGFAGRYDGRRESIEWLDHLSGLFDTAFVLPGTARCQNFLPGARYFIVYDNPTLKEREHHNVAVAVRDHAPVSLPVSGIDRVTNGRFRADVAALESLDT